MNIDNNETRKIYPDLNPTAPQESQAYGFKRLTENEAYLHDEIEVCGRVKKGEMIQYSDKHCGYRSNNINSYYWRCYHFWICKWYWPSY